MGIQTDWDNAEKTILRSDFEGKWTWDEYFVTMKQVVEMMKAVDHRVDAIANMKPGIMPISGSAMSNARTALSWLPANCGVIAIVTNPFVAALLSTFKQFDRRLGSLLISAKSVEEARERIARERRQIQPH
jgi:hypothetical protein